MDFLIAVIAITVFGCWFVDNLTALGVFEKAPKAPPALKLIILGISIYVLAKSAGII